jgi:hypothetical protein
MLSDVKFECFHSNVAEVSGLLGCDTVSSGDSQHVGNITVLVSSGSSSPRRRATILLRLLDPGDADTVIL